MKQIVSLTMARRFGLTAQVSSGLSWEGALLPRQAMFKASLWLPQTVGTTPEACKVFFIVGHPGALIPGGCHVNVAYLTYDIYLYCKYIVFSIHHPSKYNFLPPWAISMGRVNKKQWTDCYGKIIIISHRVLIIYAVFCYDANKIHDATSNTILKQSKI